MFALNRIGCLSLATMLAFSGGDALAGELTASPGSGTDLAALYARDLGLTVPPVRAHGQDSAAGGTIALDFASTESVGDEELGEMRAGFVLPGGMKLSLGFDIATYSAGELVQRISLPTTPISAGTVVPVSVVSAGSSYEVSFPAGSPGSLSVTSMANSGLSAVTTTLGATGLGSLIQNQANGQVLQQTRVLDVSVSGLAASLQQRGNQLLLSRALSAATMLHR